MKGENNAVHSNAKKKNKNTAVTSGSLQSESRIDQQHNENNIQSLFHKHFLEQNRISLDDVHLGLIILFGQTPQQTIHWHICGCCT